MTVNKMENKEKMQAIVFTKYGPPKVLQLKVVDKPTPKDNEVLVKVHAASVNAIDPLMVRGKPFYLRLTSGGILKPKHNHTILGDDIAGQVETVGRNVKQFKSGDEVFGISNWGGFAEYRCVPEDSLALKPANISFEEAAAVPIAAASALQGLRDKKQIQPGQKVLINGASGGVGTFAVQIAKYFGAEVTGVCSTSKLDMVSSIGADHVIDYTQEDFTKSGETYDLILDVAAYRSIFHYKRALSPEGIYTCIGGSGVRFFQAMFLGPLISMRGSKKLGSMLPKPTPKDFIFLKELIEAGKLVPVIDRRYPLSEVPEAIRYFGEGRARGKVVIIVKNNTET
ncbi:MAG: NAD(P)-dependent alcohol dehydrogenase [Candidatus Hodarchaeales archaeon]|jgi:NADPH:quinone reductase-like Zn-dependent oxidoreductase